MGKVRIDRAERMLEIDGQPAKLGARAFDVLLALVDRRDRPSARTSCSTSSGPTSWSRRTTSRSTSRRCASCSGRKRSSRSLAVATASRWRSDRDARRRRPRARDAPRTNLPAALAPLYGRDAERAAVAEQVRRLPLVSIVGPGGIGKSRLAQAVAHDLLPAFPDGVWLVEFAPLDDGAQLVPAAATALQRALRARPEPRAARRRAARAPMLLLLDNCEHVLDAAAELVAAVRRDAPDVQVLTTSQEPLRLADEQIVRLGTLAVPANLPLEQAQHVGALALFVARARAADPRFRLAADNLDGGARHLRAPRRHRAGDRAGGGAPAAARPRRRACAARRPLPHADRRHALRDAAPPDAARRARVEPRAADRGRADGVPPARRVRGFVRSRLGATRRRWRDDTLDRWAVLDILGALVDKSWVQCRGWRRSALPPAGDAAVRSRSSASMRPVRRRWRSAPMRRRCSRASMRAAMAPGCRRRMRASPNTVRTSTTSRRR